jgi:hypothetical protein
MYNAIPFSRPDIYFGECDFITGDSTGEFFMPFGSNLHVPLQYRTGLFIYWTDWSGYDSEENVSY